MRVLQLYDMLREVCSGAGPVAGFCRLGMGMSYGVFTLALLRLRP